MGDPAQDRRALCCEGGRTFDVQESETWAGTAVLEYETHALDDALALLHCVFAIIYEAETTGNGRWW